MQNAPYPVAPAPAETSFRQCFKCNYEAMTDNPKCPRCRSSKFFSSQNIRTRGMALIVVGLFLAGLVAAVAVLVGGALASAKNPDTVRAINKDVTTLLAIYALFSGLILLGVHFAASGLWMLMTGKRSRVLLWLMWAILFVVWLTGGIVIGLTG